MLRHLHREPGFYKRLFYLALPLILQNLITTSLGFVDTFMVGLLGQNELSAVTAANTPISLASHTMLVGNAIARTSQPSEISILTPGLYEIYYRGVAQATGEGIVFPYTISSVVALNGVPVENTRATRTVANASQAVTLSQSTATLIRSTEVGSFVLRSESPGVTWSNVVVMAAKLTDGI